MKRIVLGLIILTTLSFGEAVQLTDKEYCELGKKEFKRSLE